MAGCSSGAASRSSWTAHSARGRRSCTRAMRTTPATPACGWLTPRPSRRMRSRRTPGGSTSRCMPSASAPWTRRPRCWRRWPGTTASGCGGTAWSTCSTSGGRRRRGGCPGRGRWRSPTLCICSTTTRSSRRVWARSAQAEGGASHCARWWTRGCPWRSGRTGRWWHPRTPLRAWQQLRGGSRPGKGSRGRQKSACRGRKRSGSRRRAELGLPFGRRRWEP
mmetsp:Transcript_18133/g.51143  ORF Transcript_18133/g.51143 Transcript_18133/m.51143 type:complete len:221 (-) Transcript_18133:314-976(-)